MHRQISTMEKSATGAGAGNTGHHACASCKHQRKRCGPECVLAPYFPSTRSRQFQAVHKVFGVSNVSKMIRSIRSHDERSRAAQSMVWEAEWRIKNPVSGCYGEYLRLRRELDMLCAAWSGRSTTLTNHRHLDYCNNTIMNNNNSSSSISNYNSNAIVNNSSTSVSTLLHDEDIGRFVMEQAITGAGYPPEKISDRGGNTFGLVNQQKTGMSGFNQRYHTQDHQCCHRMNLKTMGDAWHGGL